MIKYGFIAKTNLSIEEAEKKAREELEKQGFGVIMKIDIAEKLKEKLGVTMGKYVILGACNPPNAYAAIQLEENIGLFLPCNVILYEKDGATIVGAIKPTVAMGMIDNKELAGVAVEIEARLQKVIQAIQGI
jgi:uncharacterized protein (DUF302 family)